MFESIIGFLTSPLVILLIGVTVVIGMIIVLRMNAFIALITAAMLVSLLSPGAWSEKITRVAEAFGGAAGSIGIVIAMAAVIGKCLMDSGAADRIVRSFLKLLGEKRASVALMSSGFVLSVPVFFDTTFYLLIPLARSLWNRTRKNYVLYVSAIAAGGAVTHTLVPPTPGPLYMADRLGIDLGVMMMMGCMIGLPTAAVGLVVCRILDRLMPLEMRPYAGEKPADPLKDEELPPLWISLAPVILPVLLISANTIAKALVGPVEEGAPATFGSRLSEGLAVLGNPNLALLLSAAIAMYLLVRQRGLSLKELATSIETALMSGGVIILITAGGGAFGAMLRQAGVQGLIEESVTSGGGVAGVVILLMAFGAAAVLKVAQGSGTVSMITTVSMFAAMGVTSEMLGCHLVYLAAAIGAGSLVGSWMNDSGFWIFARMSVLTEVESLKTWTILLVCLGVSAMIFTLLLSTLMPMA